MNHHHSMLSGSFNYTLLSLAIMCVSAYTMFSLIHSQGLWGRALRLNVFMGGAAVFALGLWAMHVISLLGSDYMISLNWRMAAAYICAAVLAYAALLNLRSAARYRGRLLVASLLAALSAVWLHYLAMFSGDVASYAINWGLVLLSFGINFLGAILSFYWSERRQSPRKYASSLLLGSSNMAMHLIGMEALQIEYSTVLTTEMLNRYLMVLVFLVGFATLIILCFSLAIWASSRNFVLMNERYKLLVENSLDTIALIAEDKWEFMNQSGLLMFEAQSKEELYGQPIYTLLDEKHHEWVRAWLANEENEPLLHMETPSRAVELEWRSLQGKPLSTEIVRTSTTHSGKLVTQVIIRDISERKKNEELQLNSEKLYIAGQLAAGIAHEIRNPLTALKGFLHLIASGRAVNKNYYDIMKSELTRIESIVSELLMLSKPQAAQLRHGDIRQLLAETIALLDAQANLHHVTIDYKPCSQPLWIYGVPDQIKQVFINVIKNAIEAMPSGGYVKVRTYLQEGKRVRVHIEDEGGGITKEQLAKMGQPFYTTKEKGTGLGLMVSYKIINNHQGSIAADSRLGLGTTFFITLPYAQPGKVTSIHSATQAQEHIPVFSKVE
ncbi:ATP-binding protein [Paenibacillus sp. GCM10023252]|uniref:ATP-binding protein n=1 Tax=Paenibacillus sp. GCM10023252 TaxID=3252649 RepID=UPI00361C28B8